MRSLLTLVGAAVVTFAVVGWFLGWYQVRTTPGQDGHREVNFDFNAPKIKADLKKGEDRILGGAKQFTGGNTAPAAPAKGNLPLPGDLPQANPGGPASGAVLAAPTGPAHLNLPEPPSSVPPGTLVISPKPLPAPPSNASILWSNTPQ